MVATSLIMDYFLLNFKLLDTFGNHRKYLIEIVDDFYYYFGWAFCFKLNYPFCSFEFKRY